VTLPETFNAASHFVDRHLAEGRGATIAIECGDERVSYQQVAERVNRFGSALRALGIQPEQRIALILHDTPAFAYAFFGAIKIGAVPVPLNTLWRAKDYRHALGDSGARVLVISEALLKEFLAIDRQDLPRLEHVVVVGPSSATASEGKQPPGTISFDALLADASPALAAEPTHRDAMAFWLYSSGSTGGPKGCVHLQHDMFVCAEAYAKGVLHMRASDRCFSVAKLFFAYGLGNALYMPFAVGATTILMPDAPAAPRVYETIERFKPTLFFSVPTNFGMLLAHPHRGVGGQAPGDARDFDLSSIRYAVSAGEALPESLYRRFQQRFGVEILDAIGSTECLHMFIANRPGQVRPGSSGQLVPGYDARIVDDDDRPVAVGEMGNLLIKGDSTCAYYWNQHEKTKQTIQGEWIRTGDKYYCDADGFYWYGGRTDDMLKAGGIWVSPVEIENVLIDHEAVQECAVIGRDDGDGLSKPFAYVVLRAQVSGSPELATALQQFVRERLAEYKRPRGVEFVADLPKTATGKLQRFKLRAANG
jgi:benzoate-CoA ligase family protein